MTYNTISEDVSERQCAFTIEINAREALDGEGPPEKPPNAQRGDLHNARSRVGRLRRQAQRDEGRGALILNVRVVVA